MAVGEEDSLLCAGKPFLVIPAPVVCLFNRIPKDFFAVQRDLVGTFVDIEIVHDV